MASDSEQPNLQATPEYKQPDLQAASDYKQPELQAAPEYKQPDLQAAPDSEQPDLQAASIVGCTGMVGSEILKTLLNQDQFASVAAFTRKPLTSEITSDKLKPQVQEESTSWPAHLLELSPKPATLFSGLATTRAVAGGFDKQWEIDYQLNYDLAKAAKDAGVRFYVLISSNGADSSSFMGYPKMKGKLEDDVKELGFERTIILRPGLIGGTRREEDSRPSEFAIRRLADYLGKISNNKLKDFWTQDADVTARAAVAATLECIDEAKSSTEALKPETKTIKMSDIIKLGKTDCEKQSP